MDAKKSVETIFILSVIGLSLYISPIIFYDEQSTTEAYETTLEPNQKDTVVSYDELSKSDKAIFVNALSRSGANRKLQADADYISVNGNNYILTEKSPVKNIFYTSISVLGVIFILFWMNSIFNFYQDLFEERIVTIGQIRTIFLVLSIVLGMWGVLLAPPAPSELSVNKADTAPDNATVVNVSDMYEVNSEKTYTIEGKIVFPEGKTWANIDYLKSSNNLYAVNSHTSMLVLTMYGMVVSFNLTVVLFACSFVIACILVWFSQKHSVTLSDVY